MPRRLIPEARQRAEMGMASQTHSADTPPRSSIDHVPTRCTSTVAWQELDLTGHCIREHGHDGPRVDGCWQWDDLGYRVPRDDDRRDQAERVADDVIGRAR